MDFTGRMSLDSGASTSIAESHNLHGLKRRASSPPEEDNDSSGSRKRLKGDQESNAGPRPEDSAVALENAIKDFKTSMDVEELAQELQCGCCSELVYRPVLVSPCQHFFCGSCCVLWIKNGGTNCPACRGISNIVTPFRAIQGILDMLLRIAPHKARALREREQADAVYRMGASMRIPAPREASPEPVIDAPDSSDYLKPCPHCAANNDWGWRCPQPIAENTWLIDDGVPPGHANCGNCESLLAIDAPTSTKCDMCQVSFCGISVHTRCLAAPLQLQQPHQMQDVGDLVQCAEIWEAFYGNPVEVDYMFDYMRAQRLTPVHVYRNIAEHIRQQPNGFKQLIEDGLFQDVHNVLPGVGNVETNSDAPRNRICRNCATEVLVWGLKEWWVRERQKGFLEEEIMKRKDCPEGDKCEKQTDLVHAREFNHIMATTQATQELDVDVDVDIEVAVLPTSNPRGEVEDAVRSTI